MGKPEGASVVVKKGPNHRNLTDEEFANALEILKSCKNACLYGQVLIKFEHGKIVLIEETKRHKG